jgi:hypothetical protein
MLRVSTGLPDTAFIFIRWFCERVEKMSDGKK